MRIGQHRYTIDYGHLALITLIAAAVFWYLLDARSVSLSVNNLLLVQPVALFALAMYLFIIPQCFHRVDKQAAKSPKEQDPLAPTIPPSAPTSSEWRALAPRSGCWSSCWT